MCIVNCFKIKYIFQSHRSSCRMLNNSKGENSNCYLLPFILDSIGNDINANSEPTLFFFTLLFLLLY